MAQEPITYACGHSGRERLFGKHEARAKYAAWAAKHKLCPACNRAARKENGPEVSVRGNGEAVEMLVANSFEQRAVLKSRGYGFDDWTPEWAPLGFTVSETGYRHPVVKGWSIRITKADALLAEINWTDAQGWPIKIIDPVLSGLFQSVGEGRSSLLKTLSDRIAGKKTLPIETIT